MSLPDDLREMAGLYESVADVDPPLIDDAKTLRDAANRIEELEARQRTETRTVHLWPGYYTHPMFLGLPKRWEVCDRGEFDCSRWEHRTESRTIWEPTPWESKDGAS